MTDDFENALRRALRAGEPGEPGEDFTARICSRIEADDSARGLAPEARAGSIPRRLLRSS